MNATAAPSTDWSHVDHVLLDMDGTLLDLAYDNWFWRQLVPQRYAEARGLSLADAQAELHPRFVEVQHTLPWYCTDYWSRITGLDMAAMKRETRERVQLLPGSVDFLRALRASGRRVWLATNAHPDSWTVKLEQTGLAAFFDAVICSHDFGAPKESQDFWHGLQARHPFDPARSLFADDSLPVLRAARDYGIGQLLAIRHPDSSAARREVTEFTAVDRLAELLPLPV